MQCVGGKKQIVLYIGILFLNKTSHLRVFFLFYSFDRYKTINSLISCFIAQLDTKRLIVLMDLGLSLTYILHLSVKHKQIV